MWYAILIALVILIAMFVWGFAWYPGFWIMFLINAPIIFLIAIKSKAELFDEFYHEKYRTASIVGLAVALIFWLLSINGPFLLITVFMFVTFFTVKGMEWTESVDKKHGHKIRHKLHRAHVHLKR